MNKLRGKSTVYKKKRQEVRRLLYSEVLDGNIIQVFSSFNPLNPYSVENEISRYIITACSNIQVMRIEEVILRIGCLDI